MSDDTILFSHEGHIARITLNAPARHNALGISEIRRLRECLHAIAQNDALRVLVLTGAGERTFCSGASLDQFRGGTMSGELFSTLTDQLAALPIPVVCALNGDVFGGGTEIALCCDYRIGVNGARLLVPAARIGICYPANGIRRFVERLGHAGASRLLLASEELDAVALLQTGFLQRLVERAELATVADAMASQIAALAPLAVRAMKHIIAGVVGDNLDGVAAENLVLRCSQSRDLQEGLAAQREKRLPQFTGE